MTSAAALILGLELNGRFIAHDHVAVMSLALEALNLYLLFVGVVSVTPSWTRVAADAYAERLLESLDTM